MNILVSMDITAYIASLKPMQLCQVGSFEWINHHGKLNKLNLQAVLEVVEKREEQVKEELLIHDKFQVLVHEVICVNMWNSHIYPRLISIDPNPNLSFLFYTVRFHEATCVALLDTTLFNESACEALGNSAVDLVDYIVTKLRCLFTPIDIKPSTLDTSVLNEMNRQGKDIDFKIGMRCISIVYYLTFNSTKIPMTAMRRLIGKHDIAGLLCCMLEAKPWIRKTQMNVYQKFQDEKWLNVDAGDLQEINKYEAQLWLSLYQVIMNQNLMTTQELNAWRQAYTAKCLTLLTGKILDQLPYMAPLKSFLCKSHFTNAKGNDKTSMLLEIVPEMHNQLYAQISEELILQQEQVFLNKDDNYIRNVAFHLNQLYSSEDVADFEHKLANIDLADTHTAKTNMSPEKSCTICKKPATQKCSGCSKQMYCSRECQKMDWYVHKLNCKS